MKTLVVHRNTLALTNSIKRAICKYDTTSAIKCVGSRYAC